MIIRANEIKADDIAGIIAELEAEHMDSCRKIADENGWAIGDAIEAIASHISIEDTDYISETSKAAAAMGRVKSEKKSAAVRENGKRGGRPTYNMQAMREIEKACRMLSKTTGPGYEAVFQKEIERICEKYGTEKRVVKVFDNGLKKIEIVDKDGAIVTEYTEFSKK